MPIPESILSHDFETRSTVNLLACGAYEYMSHPDTHIYMMTWAFNDEPVECWLWGQPFPGRVIDHVKNGGKLSAFNAGFERLVWWYILCPDLGLPKPAYEQFQCTAAQAKASGMPNNLGDVARCLGLPALKESEGKRLIREYSAHNVPWADIPDDDKALWIKYGKQDVEVERVVMNSVRELTDFEQYEYVINEKINDRGVPMDLAFTAEAADYAAEIRGEANGKILELTGGKVVSSTVRKTRDAWCLPLLTDDQVKVLTRVRTEDGVEKRPISFEEQRRKELLADPDLADDVRQYLELVDEAGGSGTKKFNSIQMRTFTDTARLHGALIFNGAGQTGRFSSKGLQAHNMKRSDLEPEEVAVMVQAVMDGYRLEGNESDALGELVRSCIMLPGTGLSWYDWSNIEGRMAPWLAKSPEGDAKLQLYIDGIDPYLYNASETFNIPMDKLTKDMPERQAGKVQELALQFLGGVGALRVMGLKYGMKISQVEGEKLRDGWRAANPWAMKFGRELEAAVIRAIIHPGQWYEAGRVKYAYDGGDWLWCELPSERLIAYYKPKYEEVETPWGSTRMGVTCVWGAGKPKVGEPWPRRSLHPGVLLENVTQGAAGCLLRMAIVRAYEAELEVVLHVHDEILIEGGKRELKKLEAVMLDLPDWAAGLPCVGSGGSGARYGK
tara:strand:+ start:2686 stop:4695 length:2010 start_codon:yes stop_codon:yes gene_type:complete